MEELPFVSIFSSLALASCASGASLSAPPYAVLAITVSIESTGALIWFSPPTLHSQLLRNFIQTVLVSLTQPLAVQLPLPCSIPLQPFCDL